MGASDVGIPLETQDADVGHVARPRDLRRAPAVVVIHEAFGLNTHIREACARIARAGFAVVAPDLYRGRAEQTAEYDERDRAIAMLRTIDDNVVLAGLDSAMQHLRARGDVRSRPIGVVGFRIGGRYALLWAARCRGHVGAMVSYYGPGIAGGTLAPGWTINALDASCDIQAPLLLFFAGADQTVPVNAVRCMEDHLKAARRRVTLVRYPDARPGFAFPGRDTYLVDEAADAWGRTLEFLREHVSANSAENARPPVAS